jgi:hypothetical protein
MEVEMKLRIARTLRATLLLSGIALTSACAAAAAGAGAAAGIYLTDQGASGNVASPVAMVDARTQAVLSDMGIKVTDRKEENGGVEYHGTGNGMDIAVELDAAANGGTVVKASARKNMAEWDKDYARTIVQRISQR